MRGDAAEPVAAPDRGRILAWRGILALLRPRQVSGALGDDAVLQSTAVKGALYSCNGTPFYREGQALVRF